MVLKAIADLLSQEFHIFVDPLMEEDYQFGKPKPTSAEREGTPDEESFDEHPDNPYQITLTDEKWFNAYKEDCTDPGEKVPIYNYVEAAIESDDGEVILGAMKKIQAQIDELQSEYSKLNGKAYDGSEDFDTCWGSDFRTLEGAVEILNAKYQKYIKHENPKEA